ncbi:MAG: amidohydrolase family protein [Gemmatimonadetes bacterium]|nr:amidohydrolase family protein [Gemmatimonadota bacterium]
MSNGRLHPRRSIVIEGRRIIRIEGATAATRARATLEGTGMFVIPGLWDMHVHAYFTNDTARFRGTNEVMLPLFIANGVTGVRDLGSNLEATLAARDSIAAHQLIGPRMLVSGPMIDGPTSRYAAAIKVATPDEAREAVRMLKTHGVDLIKTQTLIPRAAYFALADEATRLGIGGDHGEAAQLRAPDRRQRHQYHVDRRAREASGLAVSHGHQQRWHRSGLHQRPGPDILAQAIRGRMATHSAGAPFGQ